MATLVSTGQITIVDNNDAKPITAFITASSPTNQIYSKDDSTVSYIPDYTVTGQTLTIRAYIGGVAGSVDVTEQLTNRKWSTDLFTSLGDGTTYNITQNLTTADPSVTYYFEGDYTDPSSDLVSHIIAQIGLTVTQTGTNAVFVQLKGQTVIKQSSTAIKNTASITADLVRASGIDDSDTTYQWYELPSNTPISKQGITNWATKYGFKTTVQTNANTAVNVGTGVPDGPGFTDTKTIIVGEPAVNSIGIYKVEVKDADGKVYQGFFTVHDVSDMYTVTLTSTAGDKLQNGVGSTDIYPVVYYGAQQLADLNGWVFKWYFYDGLAPGSRAGFVDTTRTAVSGGRPITGNSAGLNPAIAYTGTSISFVAGDMVKLVTPTGTPYYYEVASSTANSVVLRIPATTSTFLRWTTALTLDQFVGGRLFVCSGSGVTAGTKSTNGGASAAVAKITVTGDEIDIKGTIMCEANRP